MLKKLNLLVLVAASLVAFGASSAAQAEGPLITNSEEEAPTNIVAESENMVFVTENGAFDCTRVELDIHLTTNANTTAHGHGTGAAYGTRNVTPHSTHCGTSSGLLFDFTSVTVNTLHLTRHNGETTGTVSVTYTYDITHPLFGLIAECTFHGEVPMKKTNADESEISGKGLVGTGVSPCPAGGEIRGNFTVTAGGEPAIIH